MTSTSRKSPSRKSSAKSSPDKCTSVFSHRSLLIGSCPFQITVDLLQCGRIRDVRQILIKPKQARPWHPSRKLAHGRNLAKLCRTIHEHFISTLGIQMPPIAMLGNVPEGSLALRREVWVGSAPSSGLNFLNQIRRQAPIRHGLGELDRTVRPRDRAGGRRPTRDAAKVPDSQ